MSDEKLFGKYHEIVLIIIGFFLTGVVGTYIAQIYTTKNAELIAANKVFDEYSKLSGNRYFAMNQILYGLNDNKKKPGKWSAEIIDSRWGNYRAELQNWNSSRGYIRGMIKLYYGEPLWSLERDIHYYFRAWGVALESEHNESGSINFECLFTKRNEFLDRLNEFNYKLGEAIQKGNIGSNKPTKKEAKHPRPEAWCKQKVAMAS